jgi:pre-mRNA-splicing helicase BRR2
VKLLEQGDIILATSIHWDALSRRWKQRKSVQNVSLYLFDDMHLLGGTEGPVLEIVVSRARYVSSQLDRPVRIVGLSSSLANARDVGDWIGAPSHCVFNFAPDVRPVPLELHISGFEASHFSSRLLAMAKPAYNSILVHSKDKPTLVFVPSRKQAQLTAIDLMTFSAVAGSSTSFLNVDEEVLLPALNAIKDSALTQTLRKGIGFVHESISASDREIVEGLYRDGIIGVLVCPKSMCWSLSLSCHLVIIMDTVFYEGRERRFVDYCITDIMQMIGFASRPLQDDVGKCVLLCYSPKKDSLKKLILESLPIESHLDKYLHDHFNAEVVTKTIENKQDAVDYLTWTFYYRRLAQNPNYYNLLGSSHRHLSDHLSELVENIVSDLEESKCLAIEDDMDLSPLNLGMISSYYYIQYTTVELYSSSVTAKTKLKGLIEILASSSEYSSLPMRQAEDRTLQKIAHHLPQQMPEDSNFEDPVTKALVLLQSHFTRQPLSTDLAADLVVVLSNANKLLQALVDVISSQGWLRPALASMELSQMIVQGVWAKDSVLLQIPHFTAEIVSRCEAHSPPVESVFDVLDLDDETREKLLDLDDAKMSDVALFCNAYPNLEVSYAVKDQVNTDFDISFNDTFLVLRATCLPVYRCLVEIPSKSK